MKQCSLILWSGFPESWYENRIPVPLRGISRLTKKSRNGKPQAHQNCEKKENGSSEVLAASRDNRNLPIGEYCSATQLSTAIKAVEAINNAKKRRKNAITLQSKKRQHHPLRGTPNAYFSAYSSRILVRQAQRNPCPSRKKGQNWN